MSGSGDRRRGRGATAFTLVEVLVVLLVTAICATAVMLMLWTPLHAATLQDVGEAVGAFDRVARMRASASAARVTLVFDVGGQVAVRKEADNSHADQPLRLPRGCLFDCLWIGGERRSGGRAEIPIAPGGLSPTYALRITGPRGTWQWLIFAGMGGDMTRLTDDVRPQAIPDVLDMLNDAQARGPHAR